MREYIEGEKVIKSMTLKKVICNKCEKEMYDPLDNQPNGTLDFCFGSRYDGCLFKFDLCDDCVDALLASFKHPPEQIA